MNDRMIRGGIISSQAVNQLSWQGQVFYHRLLLIIDDMALYEADADLLRSSLFPRNLNQVSVSDTAKLLTDCVRAGLVRTYEVEGKKYLEVKKFGQKLAFKKKVKHPPPPREEKGSDFETEVETEVEERYARPRDFLKEIDAIEYEQMQMLSGLNGEFEKCVEQWSLSVEGESGERAFKYTKDKSEDYRKLKAKFQKWINSWIQNKKSYAPKNTTVETKAIQPTVKQVMVEQERKPTYTQTEAEYAWKQAMQNQFKEFKKSGLFNPFSPTQQYREFVRRGLIVESKLNMNEISEAATEIILAQKKQMRISPKDKFQLDALNDSIARIREGKPSDRDKSEIAQQEKLIALEQYLSSITELIL